MTENAQSRPEGLRARKRRATENAIETAAVGLALEHGAENVTVEAICERAGISRSTFFNYFSSRDYAIVGRAISIPSDAEAFVIFETCPGDLTRGLFRLIFAAIGHAHVNAEVARMRARLLAEQPEAARLGAIVVLESAAGLTAAAEAWLRERPEFAKLGSPTREAAIAGSIVFGVVNALVVEGAESSGDPVADESAYERIIADIGTMLN